MLGSVSKTFKYRKYPYSLIAELDNIKRNTTNVGSRKVSPVDGSLDINRLDIEELMHPFDGKLAPVAGMLDTAERQPRV